VREFYFFKLATIGKINDVFARLPYNRTIDALLPHANPFFSTAVLIDASKIARIFDDVFCLSV
jgi:hypothetical protein